MENLWYKDAIIYALDIDTFKDSNGDGRGDFRGLQNSIDYFKFLGIDCLWLLPFYDSPNKDDGYDVRDYYSVDKRLGDLGDFSMFITATKAAGIRVIIDLVVNHTSSEHHWFRDAVKNPDSPYRDYYIWSQTKPEDNGENAILAEEQDFTNWTYNKEADAFYYHTFYNDQPDLNMTNPKVLAEVKKIILFWTKLGVDGFRVDAAPHIIRTKGNYSFQGDPHDIFRDLRDFTKKLHPNAVFLAEVDVKPGRYADFLEQDKQMHMLFNFYLNNYMFLAFVREDAEPIERALRKLPPLSEETQLANFLRNHDELDLGQLTKAEREEVFAVLAPEEEMRIFDRGIRRRLAPLFNNDQRRLILAYSLLFSLSGTPVLRYGQEIGMGDNLQKDGRTSVRTVMQWNAERNAGFSDVKAGALDQNLVTEGPYHYEKVNVKNEVADHDSLLNHIRKFIHARKNIGFHKGKFSLLNTSSRHCLAYMYELPEGSILMVHNLSGKSLRVTLEIDHPQAYCDILSDKKYKDSKNAQRTITLDAYGYRWLRSDWDFARPCH